MTIHKTLTVPLRPADAFRLFTEEFGDWWPGAVHSVSATKGGTPRAIRMNPRKGGHITEVKADGEPARWATITIFEPGRRLVFDWYVGQSENDATQVDITFTAVDTGTRVDLIHDSFGPPGPVALADGWAMALDRYHVEGVRSGLLVTA